MRATQISLAARPTEKLTTDDFQIVDVELPSLTEGTVLVKNISMQLTSVMVDLMRGEELPMPPYTVGQPLWGAAVGVVEQSKSELFAPGDVVQSMNGWRTQFVAREDELFSVPASHFPSPEVLLCQGPTAYHGMVD